MSLLISIAAFIIFLLIVCLLWQKIVIFLYKPKKDTDRNLVRSSPVQLFIAVPILLLSIYCAYIILSKDLYRMEYSVAFMGTAVGAAGIWGILDYLNFRIWYNEHELIHQNFLRIKKKFYFKDLVGISLSTGDITFLFDNGKIVLNEMSRGKERLVRYADKKYRQQHLESGLPHIRRCRTHPVGKFLFTILTLFALCFAISIAIPASDKTSDHFEGQIFINGSEYTDDFYFYLNNEKFQVRRYQSKMKNVSLLREKAAQGEIFKVSGELTGKQSSYYEAYQIEDAEGNLYLTYSDSTGFMQEKSAVVLFFILSIIMAAIVIMMFIVDGKREKYTWLYDLIFKD